MVRNIFINHILPNSYKKSPSPLPAGQIPSPQPDGSFLYQIRLNFHSWSRLGTLDLTSWGDVGHKSGAESRKRKRTDESPLNKWYFKHFKTPEVPKYVFRYFLLFLWYQQEKYRKRTCCRFWRRLFWCRTHRVYNGPKVTQLSWPQGELRQKNQLQFVFKKKLKTDHMLLSRIQFRI